MSEFAVEVGGKRVVIYTPLPHQIEFHQSKERYTIMSGGRGSGKSLALRMDAMMRCFATPRFKALIVRRSAPELKKSHLMELPFEVARLGLPKDAYHTTDMILRFPNGSLIQFGHVEDDQALTKWLSSQWEACYIDEVATFTHTQFTWLLTSLRSSIPGFVPFMRGGTNPVGPGSGFVRELFVTKTADQNPDKYPGYRPEDYRNIHCNLDDNPHIDPEVYARVFDGIPSKSVRDALRHGIWSIDGQAFSEFTPERDGAPWHVIDEMPKYRGKPVQEVGHYEIVRSIDWGYSRTGVCLWWVILTDGSAVCFQEYYFQGTLPLEVAAEIKRRSIGMKIRYTVADTAMWQEHVGPSIAEEFEKVGVGMIEADKQRKAGWVQLHTWLRDTTDAGTGKYPRLRFLKHGCPTLIRTIPEMVVDEKNPEDIQTRGVEDDGPDAARYFVMSRPGVSKEPKPQPAIAAMLRDIRRRQRRGDRLGTEATHR